jgi:exodeoxyribonuclease VII large subunit
MRLRGLGRTLESLSPYATLARGYAIVRDPATGAVVRDSAQVQVGQALEARLAVGELQVTVQDKR